MKLEFSLLICSVIGSISCASEPTTNDKHYLLVEHVGKHANEAVPHWGYADSNGPAMWGDLSTKYKACKSGSMQSPIDLVNTNVVSDVRLEIQHKLLPCSVQNNGHTIQVGVDAYNFMNSGSQLFQLIQFHFHTPSEHTVSGKPYPLVAHLVQTSESGELAVLAVFFEEGERNTALAAVLQSLEDGEPRTLNTVELTPTDLRVYRYMGSLTTPPCTQGVNWHIAKATLTASAEQIELFGGYMRHNTRPVQALNGRLLVGP